jgi:uncharacterized protein (TIGR01244 family)
MKLAVLTPNVTALAQPSVDEIAELAARGYRSIISNRAENETEDQPDWIGLKAAAAAQNMDAVQCPVVMGQIGEEQVDAFRETLERLPKPIAVFCRTGTRAALMWALANEGNLTIEERIAAAARGGYDLEPFRHRLAGETSSAQS